MLRNNHTGYDAFIQVIKNFRSMSGASIAAGATVPFIAYFAEITPPSLPGAVLITGIVQLITLILVFQFFRRSSKKTINRVLAISAPSLFLASSVYLVTFLVLTYVTPNSGSREVRGFICKREIPIKTAQECPLVGRERLKDAEYKADLIWEDWTIVAAGVALDLIWLVCFALLSTVIGTFIVYQIRAR